MAKSIVTVLQFQTLLFLFSNKILVFRAGGHKMVVRIANRRDIDQKQSDLGLCCLLRLFQQATSVKIF